MTRLLEGKVAVITGGATGIGLATAKKLVTEGAHVFIFGRRKAELDQTLSDEILEATRKILKQLARRKK